jgi:hypothetical protein
MSDGFESAFDGFLSLKDFHRAVNAEMRAFKKIKAID